MAINVQTGSTLTFERFWSWLREHANCIVRAGTQDSWFFDQEDFHWHLELDARQTPTVQLLQGKKTLAELVMDVRDVLFVQVTSEGEGEDQTTLFEVIVGSQDDSFPAYHFLIGHPFEEQGGGGGGRGHGGALKH